MIDCDWNPAIDKQASARCYRQGQTKPVYVYRLVTEGKIEDAIIQRQYCKDSLTSGIMVDSSSTSEDLEEVKEEVKISLSKSNMSFLVHPTTMNVDAVTSGGEVADQLVAISKLLQLQTVKNIVKTSK